MEQILTRQEARREDTWALEDLYENEAACRKAAEEVAKKVDSFRQYRQSIGQGAKELCAALKAYSSMNQLFERVYVYANQKLHEDMGNAASQKLAGDVEVLANQLRANTAFLEPEILKLSGETLEQWVQEEPDLLLYRYFLEQILKEKAHTLSAKEEEVLSRAAEIGQGPSNIYAMFNNADIAFEDAAGADGEKFALTQGRYIQYMESQDRVLRQSAFQNLYKPYRQFANTLASVYDANARQAAFFAKEHRYSSAREAALSANHIPESVYDQLIEAVHDHLSLLHRYMKVRKKAMKLDEMHMYDIYVPLVKDVTMKISFEEAKTIVERGLAPLGEEYLSVLKEGFENRWIDVYENKGKRTGAYSWGAYGVHPYVLMNYQGNLNNVFTLAHEMGHALHSYYSDRKQPYLYAGYSIFVAEVASILNESLLIHDLMERTEDKLEKAYLVNYFLEQFRTTLYRQTMFAEFENLTHRTVKEGGTLTADDLKEVYGKLNEDYFGPEVTVDEEIRYEWARIPHFYTPFYVYQYATGFSAAIAISSKILKGEPQIVEKYKEFLSGGSSMTPIELLKLCGVDMTKKEPVTEALQIFDEYLQKMEQLLEL